MVRIEKVMNIIGILIHRANIQRTEPKLTVNSDQVTFCSFNEVWRSDSTQGDGLLQINIDGTHVMFTSTTAVSAVRERTRKPARHPR